MILLLADLGLLSENQLISGQQHETESKEYSDLVLKKCFLR